MNNADKAIYLLKESGDLEKVPNQPYDSEDLLQSLVEKYPELLAGDQINPDEPVRLIMIQREAGVPDGEQQSGRWSVDHLLLDQNAIPTFVETKRSSDTRIRREVVGQMLDYAANAQKYWPAGQIRSMAVIQHGGTKKAETAIAKVLGIESDENILANLEAYWAKVEDNLRHGHVRLLFVADRLPPELRRVIEYLNEQMQETEVLGIELTQYVGSNMKALVPRVIGQTEVIRQKRKETLTSRIPLTEDEFLSSCPPDARGFFKQVIAESQEHETAISWNSTGFSLRAHGKTGKLITIFKGSPSGGDSDKNLAFINGYFADIDDADLRERFRQQLLEIPGTTQAGKYTVSLDIDKQNLEYARSFLKIIWSLSAELS